jgi:hypothetical protein
MSDVGSIAKKLIESAKNGPKSDTEKQNIIKMSDDEIYLYILNEMIRGGTTLQQDEAHELRRQLDAHAYFETLRSHAR